MYIHEQLYLSLSTFKTRQRIQKKRDFNFAHVYLLWAAPKQSGISAMQEIGDFF